MRIGHDPLGSGVPVEAGLHEILKRVQWHTAHGKHDAVWRDHHAMRPTGRRITSVACHRSANFIAVLFRQAGYYGGTRVHQPNRRCVEANHCHSPVSLQQRKSQGSRQLCWLTAVRALFAATQQRYAPWDRRFDSQAPGRYKIVWLAPVILCPLHRR